MNNKTDRVLKSISAKIPRHLIDKGVTKKVVDTSGREQAEYILKHPDVPLKAKAEIKKLLAENAFDTEDEFVNEEVVQEIDKYNEKAVRDAIARGELEDPNNDPFVRERNFRMKNRGKELSTYNKTMSAIKAVNNLELLEDRVLVQMYDTDKKKSVLVIPDFIKNKHTDALAYARVYKIGPKVKQIKEGQRVVINKYGFDVVHLNDEVFLHGGSDHVVALVK